MKLSQKYKPIISAFKRKRSTIETRETPHLIMDKSENFVITDIAILTNNQGTHNKVYSSKDGDLSASYLKDASAFCIQKSGGKFFILDPVSGSKVRKNKLKQTFDSMFYVSKDRIFLYSEENRILKIYNPIIDVMDTVELPKDTFYEILKILPISGIQNGVAILYRNKEGVHNLAVYKFQENFTKIVFSSIDCINDFIYSNKLFFVLGEGKLIAVDTRELIKKQIKKESKEDKNIDSSSKKEKVNKVFKTTSIDTRTPYDVGLLDQFKTQSFGVNRELIILSKGRLIQVLLFERDTFKLLKIYAKWLDEDDEYKVTFAEVLKWEKQQKLEIRLFSKHKEKDVCVSLEESFNQVLKYTKNENKNEEPEANNRIVYKRYEGDLEINILFKDNKYEELINYGLGKFDDNPHILFDIMNEMLERSVFENVIKNNKKIIPGLIDICIKKLLLVEYDFIARTCLKIMEKVKRFADNKFKLTDNKSYKEKEEFRTKLREFKEHVDNLKCEPLEYDETD